MCRLFGFRSVVLSRAHRSLVAAQNALSVQAREHRDGWGMAYFQDGDPYLLKREAGAAECDTFRRASERLATHTLVAHVRRATVGDLSPLNVHPFRHGRWVAAHNGTLHSFDRVGPLLQQDTPPLLAERVLGTTDSEAWFHWLLGRFAAVGIDPNGVGPLDSPLLLDTLAGAQRALHALTVAVGAPRPVVNFLLTNGEVFVAQRWGRELHFSTQKRRCPDASTCAWGDRICLADGRPDGRLNHLLVASERIGEDDVWEEVPEASLLLVGRDWRLTQQALDA